MTAMSRARGFDWAIVTMGVLLVLIIGAVAARGQHTYGGHDVKALAAELFRTQQLTQAALDSTTQQIVMARHTLGWLEKKEGASSAQLIEALSSIRQAHRAPASLNVVAELAATGRLDVVPDAAIRARLIALDRRLFAAAHAWEPAFERYRERLEAELSPGMWRYIFNAESGSDDIDFRNTLRELYHARFDRTLRSLLRGLEQQRVELEALSAEAAALLAALQQVGERPVAQ